MKTATSLVMGLSVVGIASAIGLFVNRSSSDRQQSHTKGQDRQAERSGALNAAGQSRDTVISAQLAALAAEVAELKGQLVEAKQPQDPNAGAERPVEAVSPEESKREWRAHLAEVEAKFGAERLDNRWAGETQSLIERGLTESPGLRAAMRKLECRSETCRLELVETGDVAGSMGLFIHQLGATLPMSKSDLIDEGNGKSVHVVYLFRSSEAT